MPDGKKLLLGTFVVFMVGVWGCAQAGADARAASRLKHLESRIAKLEEDYRAALDECVALRKQLGAAQQQCKDLQAQQAELQTVRQERDDLQQRLSVSVAERDAAQAQLARFGQELQALASKFQQASRAATAIPATTVSVKTVK